MLAEAFRIWWRDPSVSFLKAIVIARRRVLLRGAFKGYTKRGN